MIQHEWSSERYFEAVIKLAARLESEGHAAAADQIRRGLRCINGLTDGWALFLDAVEAVDAELGDQLAGADREDMRAIREAARRAVYRA